MKQDYILISKTLFFLEQGILAIGDLHFGYESMLHQQGIQLPFHQLPKTKKELTNILNQIKKHNHKLKKIILLGDIKHYFSFDKSEFFKIREFLVFLQKYVDEKNIILIRGNHDKALSKKQLTKYKNYYITKDLAFTHGNILYPAILDKKIKTIVMGHLHPAASIKDPKGIKKEKYKAFLMGRYKKKQLIILPSFFPLVHGIEINESYKHIPHFSIINKSRLQNFKVHIVGKNKVYEFGKLKDLN